MSSIERGESIGFARVVEAVLPAGCKS